MAPPVTSVTFRETRAEATFTVSSDVMLSDAEEVELPPFKADGDDDLYWRVVVVPGTMYEDASIKETELCLRYTSVSGRQTVFAQVQIEATPHPRDRDMESRLARRHNVSKSRFRLEENLVYSEYGPDYFVGDLNLCAEIVKEVVITVCIYVSDKTLRVDQAPLPPAPEPRAARAPLSVSLPAAVAANMGRLLGSGVLSDVRLCVDGEELAAHRAVLAAQSQVFATMLGADFREKATGRVVIEDHRAEIVKKMVRFMYSGCVEVDDGDLLELVVLADKYMLTELVEALVGRLGSSLHVDSSPLRVCVVLRAADLLASDVLRGVVVDYLRFNKDAVLASREWAELVAGNRALAANVILEASMPRAPRAD